MKSLLLRLLVAISLAASTAETSRGQSFTFPETPSTRKAAPSLKTSKHQWRKAAQHIAETRAGSSLMSSTSCLPDLGSPVSKLYYDRRPIVFDGKIIDIDVPFQ
jgi:hypothetical protein